MTGVIYARYSSDNQLHLLSWDDIVCKICAYNYATGMIYLTDAGHEPKKIMTRLIEHTGALSDVEYASIISILKPIKNNQPVCPVVSSIESIKGLEGDNCLFILTTDLAAYLFQAKNEENKTKNALYVALTRSTKNLTIYITAEVENKYSREQIESIC